LLSGSPYVYHLICRGSIAVHGRRRRRRLLTGEEVLHIAEITVNAAESVSEHKAVQERQQLTGSTGQSTGKIRNRLCITVTVCNIENTEIIIVAGDIDDGVIEIS